MKNAFCQKVLEYKIEKDIFSISLDYADLNKFALLQLYRKRDNGY